MLESYYKLQPKLKQLSSLQMHLSDNRGFFVTLSSTERVQHSKPAHIRFQFTFQQSSYRPFHSTETAVLWVHNYLVRSINDDQVCPLVLLDLSAAFDTVDQQILLSVLSSRFCHQSIKALGWLQSWVTANKRSISLGASLQHSQLIVAFLIWVGSGTSEVSQPIEKTSRICWTDIRYSRILILTTRSYMPAVVRTTWIFYGQACHTAQLT